MSVSPRLRVVPAVVVVGALLLAGCGSQSATDSSTAGSDAGATAADASAGDATGDGTSAGDGTSGDGEPEHELTVVATTTVMGDLVRTVVGAHATVEVLMEGSADPHVFAMSARQRGQLAAADLVVANGLGLEAGIEGVLDQVEQEGVPVLDVATFLDPLEAGEAVHEAAAEDDHASEEADHAHDDDGTDEVHHADDGHDHGPLDPHVWLDPVRMADAGEVVADRLDDLATGPWGDGATTWRDEMLATHASVTAILDPVPDACRRIVTDHDSLTYFAQRYDFEVIGTIIPGVSTDAEPSAGNLAELADTLAATGVTAIFVESTASTRAADALAAEFDGTVTVHPVPVASVGVDGLETVSALLVELATRVAEPLVDCDA